MGNVNLCGDMRPEVNKTTMYIEKETMTSK